MSQASLAVPFRSDPSPSRARVHVFIRLALLGAVGAIGCSSLYWLLYLALPAWAALLIAQKGGERYLHENGPGMVRVLNWVAAAYGYLWLLTDTLPSNVDVTSTPTPPPAVAPTVTSAMLRLLSSLPALIVLAVASCVAGVLWLLGVIAIVAVGRVPAWVTDFLGATLRYQYRLVAYHLSLVDRYPSFDNPELAAAERSTMA